GDVYERGTATEFTNWYGIDTNYGRFRSITDPVIGNHENLTPGSNGYFDYWDNIPNYYSVDTAGWHLLFIDSTGTFGQTSPSSQQYQWIAADLAANQSDCTMAIYHHPAWTIGPSDNSGDPGRIRPIWDLLADNGVDVVISGHDHNYQRWLPMDGGGNLTSGGTTQFVVGTGGHGIQGFVRSDSRVAAGFDTSPAGFGALRLELNASGAAYQFADVTGAVLDSGSVQCGGTADNEPPSAPTGLDAAAPSSNRVDLTWNAATDNVGVTGYEIWRDGSLVTTVGQQTTFSDLGRAADTTYQYQVRARDAAGNVSAPSNTATVTTPAAPGGGTFTFAPSADSYVESASPTTNNGTKTQFRCDGSPEVNSYLKFAASVGGTVTRATLRIWVNSNHGSGFDVHLATDSSWTETGITYANAPSFGPIVGSSGAFSGGSWVEVDVTSAVTGTGDLTLVLTTSSSTAMSLASRETGSTAPQLVVETQ
ncbi:MAG TPA: DNRLRE domain-containing protein, partial [Candidatus Limnocylindrales bacterium]|nr:DNRLRE domain-containing protein [Candidatus Limnocylindrales bacterium]